MSIIAVWRGKAEARSPCWHFGVLMADGSVIHLHKKGVAHTSYNMFMNPNRVHMTDGTVTHERNGVKITASMNLNRVRSSNKVHDVPVKGISHPGEVMYRAREMLRRQQSAVEKSIPYNAFPQL